MLKDKITASLEKEFSQYGFAEPSVAQLKAACNVSLRTLYKYYPSKEMMIVAALNYRHQRYIAFLQNESPISGIDATLHIFNKLEQWMTEFAPHGCLSINAISAFPDNADITSAVKAHKRDVRIFIGQQSQREDLATQLFLLHEGVSNAWPVLGKEAITSAKKAISQLMETNK
jgi:AcrR family transcriptional regulator